LDSQQFYLQVNHRCNQELKCLSDALLKIS
jgi:hypothetical protein